MNIIQFREANDAALYFQYCLPVSGIGYAIVFDIDDTVIRYRKAIVFMLKLYEYCVYRGYEIFFVTAREDVGENLENTRLELIKAGFNTFKALYLRPSASKDVCVFKTAVRALIEQSIVILGIVGDQWHDLDSHIKIKNKNSDLSFFIQPQCRLKLLLKLPHAKKN